MTRFSYKAMDAQGEIQTGEMDGQNRETILDQLTRQGLIPVDVMSVRSGLIATLNKPLFQSGKLSSQQLLSITRQATLHLFKNRFKLRQNNRDNKNHRQDHHDHQKAWVNQGRTYFFLDFHRPAKIS